jgi:exopolysaccharide biosynthesis protein
VAGSVSSKLSAWYKRIVIKAKIVLGACVIVCGLLGSFVDATQTVTQPFLGITFYHETETTPRALSINVAVVDLTAPGISFLVTPQGPAPAPVSSGVPDETVVQTTRQFVNATGVQLAVNASFFAIDNEHTVNGLTWTNNLGLTASKGNAYSPWQPPPSTDNNFDDALNITAANAAAIVKMPSTVTTGFETNPSVSLYNTVTGSTRLLTNGVVKAPSTCGSLCDLNPRTAAGLTTGNRKLILMTVDGRQTGVSEGVTLVELARYMANYGATNAINLDGGGSSTMVANYYDDRGGGVLVNKPSGAERLVGTNLGVFALPNGDFNQNGYVDAADYVMWRNSIGGQAAYDAWRQHFGMLGSSVNTPGAGAALSVPEPTGWLLTCFGAIVGWCAGSRAIRGRHSLRHS